MTVNSDKIRELNDTFRTGGNPEGKVLITRGIQQLGDDAVSAIRNQVAAFDSFNSQNDPWHEHDFGALDYQGRRVFWKIDAYDKSLTCGSEYPANPAVTTRVLTIMLAEEY